MHITQQKVSFKTLEGKDFSLFKVCFYKCFICLALKSNSITSLHVIYTSSKTDFSIRSWDFEIWPKKGPRDFFRASTEVRQFVLRILLWISSSTPIFIWIKLSRTVKRLAGQQEVQVYVMNCRSVYNRAETAALFFRAPTSYLLHRKPILHISMANLYADEDKCCVCLSKTLKPSTHSEWKENNAVRTDGFTMLSRW